MRFLKQKIQRSAELKKLAHYKSDPDFQLKELSISSPSTPSPSPHLKKEYTKSPCSDHERRRGPCENIIKNYSRAMTNFAMSPLAMPYLSKILPDSGSNSTTFKNFIKKKKRSVNCIKKLRDILPTEANKNASNYAEKKAFQALCIVFIKFFAVNWLFNSKVDNKETHLAYRFKILRRVKDPNRFTYLKDFKFEK